MKSITPTLIAHPDMLEESARGYIDTLRQFVDDPEPDFRDAAIALREMTTAALEHGPRISLDDVKVTVDLISRVPVSHRPMLLNQYAPGIGNDGSRLVAVGTEQAFELRDACPVTLHNLALTTLWLTASRPDVLAKIANDPSWTAGRDQPFHIFPNGYYNNRVGAAETTTLLSMLVGGGATRHAGTGFIPALGAHCYMLDLSVRPSRTVGAGQLPTLARRQFIETSITHLRTTAHAVLYYGSRISPEAPFIARLNAIFLGLDDGTHPKWNKEDDRPRLRLQWTEGSNGQRVIFARALSQDVPNAYLIRLREILAPCLEHD